MSTVGLGPSAPGDLELVRAFLNTLDVEEGTDGLAEAAGWQTWAASRGLAAGPADRSQLEQAVALREALRGATRANHQREPLPEAASQALDEAARWAGVVTTFGPTGLRLQSDGAGVPGLVGRVVAVVAAALADGSWSRLKTCTNDQCQWAFYDHSRSRTGQWCSMGVCGNRAKQTRWRAKNPEPVAPGSSSGAGDG